MLVHKLNYMLNFFLELFPCQRPRFHLRLRGGDRHHADDCDRLLLGRRDSKAQRSCRIETNLVK
jgi:hypothetical protein